MSHQKCEDCHSSETLSKKIMRELTLGKLVSVFLLCCTIVYSAGAGSVKLYDSIAQTNKNKSTSDSILIVVSELTYEVKKINMHLEKNGDIPANTCFLLPDSTNYTPADNVICQKDDEDEKRQRITNKETAIDQKHYQEVE